ncbi:MAG: TatD family hydrolase [Planctomycetaceae bacterium]
MASSLIDTHCHLDAEAFQQDLEDVMQRATEAGVQRMLSIGITLQTSEAAVVLANRYPMVSAVVGIQPNYAQEATEFDWNRIVELTSHPQVVGIGETGLDKYWDFAPLDIQRDFFRRHLILSRKTGKPFVVHCRDAEPEVLQMLQEDFANGPLNGVMHSFCGDALMAAECVAMGMHISFAGMVTFRKNDSLRAVAKTVPLDRLLIETDAPYLAPHPNRGKRNEPAWVRLTADCLADVHQVSPAELASATTANAQRLFRLPTANAQATPSPESL